MQRRTRAAPPPSATPASDPDDAEVQQPSRRAGPKRARKTRQAVPVDAGEAAGSLDLAAHPLSVLLASTPGLFDMLSTNDARHLRLADKGLLALIAGHPWLDALPSCGVRGFFAGWRSSFPLASGVCLHGPSLSKAQLKQLAGVLRLVVVNFVPPKATAAAGAGLPLTLARELPRLEALSVLGRRAIAVPSDAPVWRELAGPSGSSSVSRLRELALSVELSSLPATFLDGLGMLRKLDLRCPTREERGDVAAGAAGGSDAEHDVNFHISSATLARVPLLDTLRLDGLPISSGCDDGPFRVLPRLALLSLSNPGTPLAPILFSGLPASVRSLTLRNCTGGAISDASLMSLAAIRSLTCHIPASVSDCALVRLESLEELDLGNVADDEYGIAATTTSARTSPQAITDATLVALGRLRGLRRLAFTASSSISDAGVARLATCPLEAFSMLGVEHRATADSVMRLAGLRALRVENLGGKQRLRPPPGLQVLPVLMAQLESCDRLRFSLPPLSHMQSLDVGRFRDSGARYNYGFAEGEQGTVALHGPTLLGLGHLRHVDFCGSTSVTASIIEGLPATVTSLGLDFCQRLNVDDDFLAMVRGGQ